MRRTDRCDEQVDPRILKSHSAFPFVSFLMRLVYFEKTLDPFLVPSLVRSRLCSPEIRYSCAADEANSINKSGVGV